MMSIQSMTITYWKEVEAQLSEHVRHENVCILVLFVWIAWLVTHTRCKCKLCNTVESLVCDFHALRLCQLFLSILNCLLQFGFLVFQFLLLIFYFLILRRSSYIYFFRWVKSLGFSSVDLDRAEITSLISWCFNLFFAFFIWNLCLIYLKLPCCFVLGIAFRIQLHILQLIWIMDQSVWCLLEIVWFIRFMPVNIIYYQFVFVDELTLWFIINTWYLGWGIWFDYVQFVGASVLLDHKLIVFGLSLFLVLINIKVDIASCLWMGLNTLI